MTTSSWQVKKTKYAEIVSNTTKNRFQGREAKSLRETSGPACILFMACPGAEILMEVKLCSNKTTHDRG